MVSIFSNLEYAPVSVKLLVFSIVLVYNKYCYFFLFIIKDDKAGVIIEEDAIV